MAKKGNRQIFLFQCSICKTKNYTNSKNVINIKDKLSLNKFCAKCRKHTEHQETKVSK